MIEYLKSLEQLGPLGPAVGAALIAATVAFVSLLVSTLTTIGLQVWKARIDRQSAREKTVSDRELATQKFSFDTQLAERKAQLDVRLADRKRRTELAEAVLTDIYRARDAIAWARHPIVRGNEGSTRPRSEGETEEEASHLDSLFVAVERLSKEGELFARLDAHKPRLQANFGHEAGRPLDEFRAVHNRIVSASYTLMRMHRQGRGTGAVMDRQEAIVSGSLEEPDPIAARIDNAVAAMEAICRPILGQEAPQL